MHGSGFNAGWLESLAEIEPREWNRLAARLTTPFLDWEWLRLMEVSGSTAARTGWIPRHLTLRSGTELVAAAPLYIKTHSAGEFVFDHAWADVAARLGKPYYPKLVGMSPFTPMIGYRFLVAEEIDETEATARLLGEIERQARRLALAGCSFHFVDPEWTGRVAAEGYSAWAHQSFEWKNEGYRSFEDFLARFNSNQRRNIRREQRALEQGGVRVQMIPGPELERKHFARMYDFYARTNARFGPWGCKYLTRAFFQGLPEFFADRLVFAVAFARDRKSPLGMSLLAAKGPRLFGRYWGCETDVDFLHFSACYYQPIEWAIARGLQHFDPGMGGEHKLRRGFTAVPNHSLHRFFDPTVRRVMEMNIDAINRYEQDEIDTLNEERPLRRSQG